MKKRLLKNAVATLALVSMLMQNMYGAVAVMASDFSEGESFYEESEDYVEDDYSAGSESSDDSYGDDYDYQSDDWSEDMDGDEYDDWDDGQEDAGETEEIPENLEIFSNQISGSGLDYVSVRIVTDQLNNSDRFRLIFTGAENARYDRSINDDMDASAAGTYTFENLNKEGFNIRTTSDDDVSFVYSSDGGTAVIEVISNSSGEKNIYKKTIKAYDGSPVNAVYGTGYENVYIDVDTSDLDEEVEYTVYVDTQADVTVNGSSAKSFKADKELSYIEILDLNNEDFAIYAVSTDETGIDTGVGDVDVENGRAVLLIAGKKPAEKTVYAYIDADVTVTATLDYAEAVPDNAEFVVTPITVKNVVSAYLDALNDAEESEDMEYTTENTLLYDIAFIVTDEDGVQREVQPDEGSVKIDIKFNKSQLSEDIEAEDGNEVVINHLPIKESAKSDEKLTAELTSIDPDDIIVQPVSDADVEVVENGADNASFSLDSFSVVSFTYQTDLWDIVIEFKNADGSPDYHPVLNDCFLYVEDTSNQNKHAIYKIDANGEYKNWAKLFFSRPSKIANENLQIYILQKFYHGEQDPDSNWRYDGNGNYIPFDLTTEQVVGMYKITPPNNPSVDWWENGYVITAKKVDCDNTGLDLYKTTLGKAVEYGVTANEYDQTGDTQTNFATKYFSGGRGPVGGDLSNNPGIIYVGSIKNGLQIRQNLGRSYLYYGTQSDRSKIVDDSGKANIIYSDSVNSYVDSLISKIVVPSNDKMIDLPKTNGNKIYIDTTAQPDNAVIHINLDGATGSMSNSLADICKESDGLNINKKPGQTIVFHSSKSSVTINQFQVANNGDWNFVKTVSPTGNGDGTNTEKLAPIAKSIIWDFSRATSVTLAGAVAGVFLAPNATVTWGTACCGWVVCNIARATGEWHNIYQEVSDPTVDDGYCKFTIRKSYFEYPETESIDANNQKYITADGANSIDWPVDGVKFKVTQLFSGDGNIAGSFNAGQLAGSDREFTKDELGLDDYDMSTHSGTITLTPERQVANIVDITFKYDQDISRKNKNNQQEGNGSSRYIGPNAGWINNENAKTNIDGKTAYRTWNQTYFFKIEEDFDTTDMTLLDTKYQESVRIDKHADSSMVGKIVPTQYEMYKDSDGNIYVKTVRYLKIFVDYWQDTNPNDWYWGSRPNFKWVIATPNWSNSTEYCCGEPAVIDFKNTRKIDKGSIKVTKETKFKNNTNFDTDETFYFVIKNGDTVSEAYSVGPDNNYTRTVDGLTAGTGYSVVETDSEGNEVAGTEGFNYTVTVSPDSTFEVRPGETSEVKITNTYKNDAEIVISGRKEAKAGTTVLSLKGGEFEFILEPYAEKNATAPMPNGTNPCKVTNGTNNGAAANDKNEFTFPAIKFTSSDLGGDKSNNYEKHYYYLVTENVKVTVGNGIHSFTNTEKYIVDAKVYMENKQIKATYTKTKVDSNASNPDILFKNEFEGSESVEFKVTKNIAGRQLREGEFTFYLEPVGDAPFPENAVKTTITVNGEEKQVVAKQNTTKGTAVSNTSDTYSEVISFGTVTYDLDKAKNNTTYQYKIYEKYEGPESGIKDGVKYDTTVYVASVKPTFTFSDNKLVMSLDYDITDGTSSVKNAENAKYVEGVLVFNPELKNIYGAEGSTDFRIRKSADKVPDSTAKYTFKLSEKKVEGTTVTWEPVAVKSVNGPGYVDFINNVQFGTDGNKKPEGTYYYKIDEIPFPNESGEAAIPSDAKYIVVGGTNYCARLKDAADDSSYYGIMYNVDPVYFAVKAEENKATGTYDIKIYACDADGNLGAEVGSEVRTSDSTDTISVISTITNDYSETSIKKDLDGVKYVNGGNPEKAHLFSFTIANIEKPSTVVDVPVPKNAAGNVVKTVWNGENGAQNNAFKFPEIEFKQKGTYVYTVKENPVKKQADATDDDPTDMKYSTDPTVYVVTFVVDDAAGKPGCLDVQRTTYSVQNKDGNVSGIEFNNYKPTGGATLKAHKYLTDVNGSGTTLAEGQFLFGVFTAADDKEPLKLDANGRPDANGTQLMGTNGAGGVVNFDKSIKYELDDLDGKDSEEFTYYVKEIFDTYNNKEYKELEGYEYDLEFKPIKVKVSKDTADNTKLKVEYYNASADVPYQITCPGVDFTNKFTAKGEVQLYVQKSVSGYDINGNLRTLKDDDEFEFTLKPKAGQAAATSNGADTQPLKVTGKQLKDNNNKIPFASVMEFTKAGTYYYTIEETYCKDETLICDTPYDVEIVVSQPNTSAAKNNNSKAYAEMPVSVKMKKSGSSANYAPAVTASFVNRSVSGGEQITVYKTLDRTGQPIQEGEFTFELYKLEDGEFVKKDSKSTPAGSTDTATIAFDLLRFGKSDVDKDHIYMIKESLQGTKDINGQPVKNKIVYDTRSYYAQIIVADPASDESSDLVITGPKYYQSYENGQLKTEITNPQDVTFNNKYIGTTSVQFSGKKDFKSGTGKNIALKGGEFKFQLTDINGNPIIQQILADGTTVDYVTNNADGNFEFNEITYGADDLGVAGDEIFTDEDNISKFAKYYYIKEVDESSTNSGIRYDDKKYIARVVLWVTADGNMHRSVKLYDAGTGLPNGSGIDDFSAWVKEHTPFDSLADLVYRFAKKPEFNNTYTANGKLVLSVEKDLRGLNWDKENASFIFELIEEKENPVANALYKLLNKLTNNKNEITIDKDSKNSDGRYIDSFEPIMFSYDDLDDGEPVTCKYTLKESTVSKIPGLKYDDNYYEVLVTVSDNKDGTLKVETTITHVDKSGNPIEGETPLYTNGEVPEGEDSDGIVICQPEEQVFINIYEPDDTEATAVLGGTKDMIGRSLTDLKNEGTTFTFNIVTNPANATNIPLPESTVADLTIGDSGQTGSFRFGTIKFEKKYMLDTENGGTLENPIYLKERTFNYIISEHIPSESDDDYNVKVGYDTSRYLAKVVVQTVVDETTGAPKFVVPETLANGDDNPSYYLLGQDEDDTDSSAIVSVANYRNTYDNEEYADFYVSKTIQNMPQSAQTFNFSLSGIDEAGNAISMSAIDVPATNEAVKMIADSANVSALIKDDADGNKSQLTFTVNGTKANGTKTEGKDNEYVATYEYTIIEDRDGSVSSNDVPGLYYSKQIYKAIVTVTADTDDNSISVRTAYKEVNDSLGNSVDRPTAATSAQYQNAYISVGSTSVDGSKTFIGRDMTDDEEFVFDIYEYNEDTNESELLDTQKIKGVKKGETVSFGFPSAGKTYFSYDQSDKGTHYYIIKEQAGTDRFITYDKTAYIVKVDIDDKRDSDNNPILDGELNISQVMIKYTGEPKKNGELVAWMQGVLSQNTEESIKNRFSVDVAAFTNHYKAECKWDPRGYKAVRQGDQYVAPDNMYTFQIMEVDESFENVLKDGDAERIATATNNGNEVIFPDSISFLQYKIEYNEATGTLRNDTGNHYYIVKESPSQAIIDKAEKVDGKYVYNGITYDNAEYRYVVNVYDDGNGELKYTVDATRNPQRDFNDLVESATQDVIDAVDFIFVNKYSAEGSIYFDGYKKLEGRTFDEGETYNFTIVDVKDENNVAHVSNVPGAEVIHFGTEDAPLSIFTYDEKQLGLHQYYVTEDDFTKDGVVKDTSKYLLNIYVADNYDGTLNVTQGEPIVGKPGEFKPFAELVKDGGTDPITNNDDFVFTNTYSAEAAIRFAGTKHLRKHATAGDEYTSAEDLEGKFSFRAYSYTDADRKLGEKQVGPEVKCDAKGSYSIDGPVYKNTDLVDEYGNLVGVKTFYYKIIEKVPEIVESIVDGKVVSGGIIYSDKVYNVDVTVTDTRTGDLIITAVDHETGAPITPVDADGTYVLGGFDFTNIKPEYVSVTVKKRWNDSDIIPAERPEVYVSLDSGVNNYHPTWTGQSAILRAPDYSYTFEHLDKLDKDGNVIQYSIRETPIDGYYLAGTVITKDEEGNIFVELDNIQGEIFVHKYEAGTLNDIAGATLAIYTLDGRELEKWVSGSFAHKVETKLTPGAEYILRELEAPTGYNVAADVRFTVRTDVSEVDPQIVEMSDPKIKGNVRLRKLDADTREALAGAEFALYTEDGTRVYASGSAGAYRYSDISSNGRFAVDSRGVLDISDLPYGTYYFVEIAAPAGYELNPERLSFSVLTEGEVVEVSMLNTKLRGAVRLTKTNVSGVRTLSGAVFELYARTPRSASDAIASTIYRDVYYRVGTYTTDASGSIYVGDLPWDDYYFIEVEAPDGYVLNRDVNGDPVVYTFTIDSSTVRTVAYDLGSITNDTGEVRGRLLPPPEDTGRRLGGVLSGVLGVRAAPDSGVLGERVGPVTGDAANMILWLLLLVACLGTIIGMVAKVRKREKKIAR